jgi:predicted Zn-dependent protease
MHRVALVMVCVLVGGCSTLNQLNFLSTADEVEIGRQAAVDIERQMPMLKHDATRAYIDSLGRTLVGHSKRQDIQYHFNVVETGQVNAFALPGGWLYVNAGLIATADTEAELAGVLAHEIGHVVGRHGARQISSQYGLAVLLEVVAGGSGGGSISRQIAAQFAGIGAGLAMLKYSRDMEREADQLAVEETYAAGIDPKGISIFFEKLMVIHEREPSGVDALFTTHPPSAERIANVDAAVRALPLKSDLRGDSEQFRKIRAQVKALLPAIEARENKERERQEKRIPEGQK